MISCSVHLSCHICAVYHSHSLFYYSAWLMSIFCVNCRPVLLYNVYSCILWGSLVINVLLIQITLKNFPFRPPPRALLRILYFKQMCTNDMSSVSLVFIAKKAFTKMSFSMKIGKQTIRLIDRLTDSQSYEKKMIFLRITNNHKPKITN